MNTKLLYKITDADEIIILVACSHQICYMDWKDNTRQNHQEHQYFLEMCW